jgi:hypothetical protein
MSYKVETEPSAKNTITISRHQLWKNFMDSWGDLTWDDNAVDESMELLRSVREALCTGPLDSRIRKLFSQGNTYLLMGDAMEHIDLPAPQKENTLLKIVVVDKNNHLVINHRDIRY